MQKVEQKELRQELEQDFLWMQQLLQHTKLMVSSYPNFDRNPVV